MLVWIVADKQPPFGASALKRKVLLIPIQRRLCVYLRSSASHLRFICVYPRFIGVYLRFICGQTGAHAA